MKSSHQKSAAWLLIVLLVSALLLTATGLILKHTVGRSSQQIQETMAIVVPFVLLRGDIALEAMADQDEASKEEPAQGDEPSSEPSQPEEEPQPVPEPEWGPVEESYFDTVLFIGDSRTVGLSSYARLGQAHYFADVGMNLFNLFEKTISDGENFKNQTLRGVLSSKPYTHIYVMLGINEIGYPPASLTKKMTALVMELRNLQPDAKIILQANLAVTQAKAQKNPAFALDKIQALNTMIASYAENEHIFYLDANPCFADENGYLRADVTGDGVHPYAKEYKNWSLWLKDHALLDNKADVTE